MKKYFGLAIIIIILAAILSLLVFVPKSVSSGKEVIFQVKAGQGIRTISDNLQKAGLISWAPLFQGYALLSGKQGKLQAGYYSLSPSMKISAIVEKMASGNVKKVGITVFEGSNLAQVHLYTNVPVENERLADFRSSFDFLSDAPQNATSLEGYLFPDTYYFDYGDNATDVARVMLTNFGKKLTPTLRAAIKAQGKTIYEIVTVASLIEKEVATKNDKEIVSGILWKRLKDGMQLQVDSDPWTYKNLGLPPGPICSPGLDSIEAAIYPQASSYFYFISAPDGTTIFSKTLQEQNAAIAKYLK